MSEEVKFTEEEMKSIQGIQDEYFEVQNNFGKLNLSRIKLEQQLDELDSANENLTKKFTEPQKEIKDNPFMKPGKTVA